MVLCDNCGKALAEWHTPWSLDILLRDIKDKELSKNQYRPCNIREGKRFMDNSNQTYFLCEISRYYDSMNTMKDLGLTALGHVYCEECVFPAFIRYWG